MEINESKFVMSNTDWKKCPKPNLPEYAFIGRSNVGKSSLINMITGRKALAKVSGKPGKTQLINHFIIDNNWYICDLPGYGYAKVSKKDRSTFQSFTLEYLKNRENLVGLFLLIDCRHAPQKIDLEFMEFCGKNNIPFVLVFTKMDKLTSRELNKNLLHYKKELLKTWEFLPEIFVTSSSSNYGRDQILQFIENLNNEFVA